MPKVSIIMGVYNCEDSLSTAIESIIQQSFQDWEMIICDDCSSDNSYVIAKNYSKNDKRIIVIRNDKNIKLAASLNKCLSIASGEYVARMDADDRCYPNRLAVQVEFLDCHPEFAVVGSEADLSDGEKIISRRKNKEIPTAEDALHGAPFMHPSIMMRKSVYDALGGYTVAKYTQRGQDRNLWFKFFAAGYKGYNIQEPLFVYRINDKKRSFKAVLLSISNAYHGYKIMKVPAWKYIFIFSTLVSYFIPEKIKRLRRHEVSIVNKG